MLQILVALIVLGLLLYVVNLLPIDGTIKKIINAVAIVLVVIWILGLFFPAMWNWGPVFPHR
jgi:hypothetical protein